MSVPVTIYLPKATIDAIRDSAGINSNIRTIAHATAVTMPAVIAAVNNIPADVVPVTSKREAEPVPAAANKRKKFFDEEFEVIAKNPEGLCHAFKVDEFMPIEELVEQYSKRSGIPAKSLRLLYDGDRLVPGKTIGDYEMVEGDIIEAFRVFFGS